MRIGISIHSHQGQSAWENGLIQNVIFLTQCLREVPFVREVILLDAGDGAELPAEFLQLVPGSRVARPEQVEQLDLIIEMADLDAAWLAHMRERGAKVVCFVAGQPYAGMTESQIFNKPGRVSKFDRCDEIWLLPEYREFAAMLRSLHRCPVKLSLYLWAPDFIELRKAALGELGTRYGWRAAQRPAGWRVGMLEPNISVVKSSSIPMLACDQAYRERPEAIHHMLVYNSQHLAEHRTMLHFANSLELVKQHRATFLGRHDVVSVLASHVDAVVSHQWTDDQNYLYLDVLYGGYPLIHNSLWLGDAGYYYPEFDAHAAAQALLLAHATHDENLTGYNERTRQIIERVDPRNPVNVESHASLLLGLLGDRLPAHLRETA